MASPSVAGGTRVGVVVLNYNGLADTLLCLRSLKNIPDSIYAVLVDNASEVDPTADALDVYPELVVVRTSENLGYAGGNNRGIQLALEHGCEYVLVLNNDTVVAPDIIRQLLDVFASRPMLGIVGPVVNFLDEPGSVMTDGVRFNPGPGFEVFHRIVVPLDSDGPGLVDVDIVNGCCMMIRRAVLETVGRFDEQFFIVHEESDLCLRAKRAGFSNGVLGRSLVWHKGSSAFDRSGRQLQRYFDTRNLLHLLRRHTGRVSRSRPLPLSLWRYGWYAFYRYATEREAGKPAAARAVIEGLYDGARGWFGPHRQRPRSGLWAVTVTFAALWMGSSLKQRTGWGRRGRSAEGSAPQG
jgi:GT2 family glycosyltransferase